MNRFPIFFFFPPGFDPPAHPLRKGKDPKLFNEKTVEKGFFMLFDNHGEHAIVSRNSIKWELRFAEEWPPPLPLPPPPTQFLSHLK